MPRVIRRFRSYFLAGTFALLPIAVTVYVFMTVFKWLDSLSNTLVELIFHQRVQGIGFLLSIVMITLIGLVATNVVGRQLISFGEKVLRRIPLASTIYSSTKQLIDAFTMTQRQGFNRVVLVEYPRQGIYSIGFVSNRATGELQAKSPGGVLCVFVPTAPNPTSGFLIMAPEEDCISLDLTVEDAFKVIISGGLILPD